MAKKKPALNIDLFARTERPAETETPADPITAKGVGLRTSEWAEIDALAKANGMNRHELAVKLLRYGLDALKAGRIKSKSQKTLDL